MFAGDKAFVDYSGKRIGIADPATGEIREAENLVAVLGASNLTYAEATWTQQLPDWIGAHVRMFRFFGGSPEFLVPDNLKSSINGALFYDPESTAPTARWPRIIPSESSQHVLQNLAIRPKSKPE